MDWVYWLNSVFTTRIKSGYVFLRDYGTSFFGKEIETIGTRQALLIGEETKILDMGYLHLAINNGVIILILFLIMLTIIQIYAIKKNNLPLLLCNTYFIILGFTETYIYIVAFNFVLIAFFYLIKQDFNKKSIEVECVINE